MTLRLMAQRLRPAATLPRYATRGAAGLDLFACMDGPLAVTPGSTVRIPTGVAVAIPPGYFGLVRDRSGLAVVGLHTAAGVIDSDYRGELQVVAHNAGIDALVLQSGDRIAQLLVLPCPPVQIDEVSELPHTERGSAGFGSTGR